jgi:hypothetical protein
MTGSIKWQMVLVAALAAAQLGCRGDSTTEPGLDARKIEALSSRWIVGTVGGFAPVVPAIRVTNSRTGRAEAGVGVRFILRPRDPSAGSLGRYSALTDSAGVASVGEWQFGERAGMTELLVDVEGFWITFSARVEQDVPDHVRVLSGQDQAGIAGQTVIGLSVRVEDRFSNGIPELEVKFSIIQGGGTLESEKDTTDQYGAAYSKAWLLGAAPGTNQAIASVAGLDPALFRAEGLDSAALKWYKLVSLKSGSYELLETSGIADGRIGLTAFDECLCREQKGFFVRTRADERGRKTQESGAYVLSASELYAPPNWSKGAIDGELLVLIAPDPWDGEWDYAWIYREVKESGQ